MKPPQDFYGFYPPPFGPKGPSDDKRERQYSIVLPPPLAIWASSPSSKRRKAIEALAGFHLWRLRAVASDAEACKLVDYVAFETVPHLRELRAIKVAMARFDAETRGRGSPVTGVRRAG